MNLYFAVILSLFLIILLLIYFSAFLKNNSKLDKFVTRLPIASQFLIGFGILVTFMIFLANYQETIVKETVTTIKETFLQTLEILDNHKDKCPNLISSLFYPWQKENVQDSFNNSLNEDDPISKMYVVNYIFQTVGLYVQESASLSVSNSKFLAFFASLYNSKILREEWEKYKANFGTRARLLIEELFKINETHTFNNYEELIAFFDKYSVSHDFVSIIKTRDSSSTRRIVFF
jgi:hypothetical protein